ncbi:MAG: hypothetical protein KKG64_01855 [Firmicutes bacterium]|nr:hypothetical protein [Bacillota bacterium]
MRIDKFLSNLKYDSRCEIKSFLSFHDVKIDGIRILNPNFEVNPITDIVYLDQKLILCKYPIYLAINKPQGYLSANKDKVNPYVVELLEDPYNRFDMQ